MAAGEFFEKASGAIVASFVASAAPATLYRCSGFNDSGATVYVQIHNSAIAPPGAGAVPKVSMRVPAGATFSFRPDNNVVPGMYRNGVFVVFGSGIVIAASTTPATFTAAPASLWINCAYREVL